MDTLVRGLQQPVLTLFPCCFLQAAKAFAKEQMGLDEDDAQVVSSWGPYTSTAGTAKKTGVAGLTTPAKV